MADNTLALPLPSMSNDAIERVRKLEEASLQRPQVRLKTQHDFHAGVYIRTISIPAGVVVTGVLIQIPTVLIVSGHVAVLTETGVEEVQGYKIFLGEAGRKTAVYALEDTHISMLFSTNATTVEEAEEEFTAEGDLLASRKD